MKKDRKRLLLLSLFLLLILLGGALSSRIPAFFSRPGKVIPFRENEITEIKITGKTRSQSLTKDSAGYWVESEGVRYRGDEEKITGLTAALLGLTKNTIVSDNKKNRVRYGIASSSITVSAKNKRIMLYIGNPESENNIYASRDGENEVFVAQNMGNGPADLDYRDLRPHLVDNPGTITELRIEQEGSDLTLTKKGADWYAGDQKADNAAVNYYLDELSGLTSVDIITGLPLGLPSSPLLTVSWKDMKNGYSTQFFEKDEKETVMTTSRSDYIYIVPRVYAASLIKGREDFIKQLTVRP